MTKNQRQAKEWLYSNHWREWASTRKEEFEILSSKQQIWCCCGGIASSLHEERCSKFQDKVDRATIAKLKHLLPK